MTFNPRLWQLVNEHLPRMPRQVILPDDADAAARAADPKWHDVSGRFLLPEERAAANREAYVRGSRTADEQVADQFGADLEDFGFRNHFTQVPDYIYDQGAWRPGTDWSGGHYPLADDFLQDRTAQLQRVMQYPDALSRDAAEARFLPYLTARLERQIN